MVTLLEINKAINNKIEEALANTDFKMVPIVASDILEPIARPSIKVQIENSNNGLFNSQCREKNLTIRVYFFASDRNKYKMENLKMQDLLENAFLEDLQISDSFYIPIEEVESEVIDTVLECSFELYTIELLPSNDPDNDISEFMEELNLNM